MNVELENILKDLDVNWAHVPIGDKKYTFVSAFADACMDQVADHMIINYQADVSLVVNLKSNRVSLRKNESCPLELEQAHAELSVIKIGMQRDGAGPVIGSTMLNINHT